MGVFDFLPDEERQRAIDALAARSGAPPLLQSPDAAPAPAAVPDAMTPDKLLGFLDTMRARNAPRPEDAAELKAAQEADRKAERWRGLESGMNRAASLISGTHQAEGDLPLPKNVVEYQQQKALRDAERQAAERADKEALVLLQAAPKITTANVEARYAEPEAKAKLDLTQSHAQLYGAEAKARGADLEDKERWRQALLAGDSNATAVARGLAGKLMPSMRERIEVASGAELVPLLPLMEKAYGAEQMAAYRQAVLGDKREARKDTVEGKDKDREVRTRKLEMLSDAQTKTIAEYDKGIHVLDRILDAKKKANTGPWAARGLTFQQWLGSDDPEASTFKAMVGDNAAMYIRSLSGAAVSDHERAFLLANIPRLEDKDATFVAKAKIVSKRLAELRAIDLDNMRKQGKSTSAFEVGPSSSAAATTKGTTTVTVMWKGKAKTIPAEKLQEALAAGATEVK